jgi:DNA polymerase I
VSERILWDQLPDLEEVVLWDFEYVAKPGERPDVVCLAWHLLSTGGTYRLWRDQLGDTPPFRIDDRTLFVCFVANAELGCHLNLGWPLPTSVLDLSPEFRRITNGREVPNGRGLLGAMAYYKLDAIDVKQKEANQKRISQGWPFTPEEKETFLKYVVSDVDAMVRLLPVMLPEIGDLGLALLRGTSVSALARMEHHGVPIDGEIFQQLSDDRAWAYARDAMVPSVDAAYGVNVYDDASGDWKFSMEKFAAYLERERIAWPRTETGRLSISEKVFESMGKAYPQLESLRQLLHVRNKMRRVELAVGADFRNRATLWPFKAKTSRIQPKAAQWIFSPATWLRSLIKPGPGFAIAYLDWSSMEFMVAAGLSGDSTMIQFYNSGDPYLSFARRVGGAPSTATKHTHSAIRERYKTGMLAIQYGAGPVTLACSLGTSVFEAGEMITQHRELFPVYWHWARDWAAYAFDVGGMRTPLDWRCITGITEFNERSITNFPVQASAADALRLTCIWATKRDLRLLAPVHDALVIESPVDQIDRDVSLLRELMRRASRVILNPKADGSLELRTDATIVRYPDRYVDKRGTEMWERVMTLLAEYREKPAPTMEAI